MIITKTPLRISFLGGGTDYPDHFLRHGGATLGASIDKYTIITVNTLTRFVDYRIRVHYSKVESVSRIDQIEHPSARECLRFMGIDGGIEIHYLSDLPARTGLGSSSSATVGLLNALHAFKGERADRKTLAAEAVHVEQEMIRENVGCQDQYMCALGGLVHLGFRTDGQVETEPVRIDRERLRLLEEHLMLFYTGIQREAHTILQEQMKRTQAGQNLEHLSSLKELVARGVENLSSGAGLEEFGRLLHQGWLVKRRLSTRVTSGLIDGAYEKARAAGAVGGKLLGAGGGGFLLLFVRPQDRQRVRDALPGMQEAAFAFDGLGSTILFEG